MTKPAFVSVERLHENLRQLCALPGSPEQHDDLVIVANRVAAMMRQHGLQTNILPTAGAPVVLGRRAGRSPFTLLLYHHYDVAPTGPWRAWHHDPFQLAERDDALFGRGVADGKGPLVAHLAALAGLLEAVGELPCGVVVLAEGEALAGSPNLGSVINEHRDLIQADACLATGGELDAAGHPLYYSGAKGLLQLRLTAVGANQALMPGLAASVPNPLWRLIWAISQIKSDQEEILIGNFYDDVDSPERSANQAIRATRVNEAGRLEAWGLNQFLFGMSEATLVSAEATLPTCNVSALEVEPISDLAAIPVVASARIDFQLVPHQRPQVVVDLLREHLLAKGAVDVETERLNGGYPPALTSFAHPFLQQVHQALREIHGAEPAQLPLGPFALPLFFFTEAYTMPVATIGCAGPHAAIYGPNEHIPLANLLRHGELLCELLNVCATDERVRG